MEQPRLAVITVVVVLVEPVPLDKNVAEECVSVCLIVLAETVEMMDVVEIRVVSVLPLKLVQMESVPELPLLIVPVDHVVPIELVEVADLVLLDKDAELDNVSVTMIVTKRTVVTLSNLKEQTLVCALKDLAELAPQVSLVVPLVDVQHPHRALSQLQSLIVLQDVQLEPPPRLPLAPQL